MKRYFMTGFVILANIVIIQAFFVIPGSAELVFGPEQIIQANGVDIRVPGYSVPSFVFWNGDSLPDLVIGEGSGVDIYGKVRVYINSGTSENPLFTDSFYVQSNDNDLVSAGGG